MHGLEDSPPDQRTIGTVAHYYFVLEFQNLIGSSAAVEKGRVQLNAHCLAFFLEGVLG